MRRRTSARAVFVLLFACGAALAAELVFPNLTGRVVDQAGLLDAAQEATLAAKLEALEEKTTDQFVVVTLNSLQDTSIEDFGYRLGRHWAIGQKDKNNGVLLIVAPNERKVRIEVGYGLEGVLTDALTRLIVETSIAPRFRDGDMEGGILAGADDVIAVLSGDAAAIAERQPSWPRIVNEMFVTIFIIVIVLIVLFNIVGGWRGGRWSSGGSSGGSWSSSGGGFSGGGGSFGGGGSSGSW
jgi:uncharacterized protein